MVCTCVFMPIDIGSFRTDRFEVIWNHPVMHLLRDRDDRTGHCRTCDYKLHCGGCRARSWGYFRDLRRPDAGCTATIQDEGGNIPPEAIPHLFDRFYRVESSRGRNTGGAGLGLAIARGIAMQHGGDLCLTSTPDTSTTFHVRLPCERRCDDPPTGGVE